MLLGRRNSFGGPESQGRGAALRELGDLLAAELARAVRVDELEDLPQLRLAHRRLLALDLARRRPALRGTL
jgi:hypothetical protein